MVAFSTASIQSCSICNRSYTFECSSGIITGNNFAQLLSNYPSNYPAASASCVGREAVPVAGRKSTATFETARLPEPAAARRRRAVDGSGLGDSYSRLRKKTSPQDGPDGFQLGLQSLTVPIPCQCARSRRSPPGLGPPRPGPVTRDYCHVAASGASARPLASGGAEPQVSWEQKWRCFQTTPICHLFPP